MAMTCPRCQHDNRDDARFCPDCGARLTLPARSVAQNCAGERFCGSCGTPADQADAAARTARP